MRNFCVSSLHFCYLDRGSRFHIKWVVLGFMFSRKISLRIVCFDKWQYLIEALKHNLTLPLPPTMIASLYAAWTVLEMTTRPHLRSPLVSWWVLNYVSIYDPFTLIHDHVITAEQITATTFSGASNILRYDRSSSPHISFDVYYPHHW